MLVRICQYAVCKCKYVCTPYPILEPSKPPFSTSVLACSNTCLFTGCALATSRRQPVIVVLLDETGMPSACLVGAVAMTPKNYCMDISKPYR